MGQCSHFAGSVRGDDRCREQTQQGAHDFTQVRAARGRKTLLLPLGVLVVLCTSTRSALPRQEV